MLLEALIRGKSLTPGDPCITADRGWWKRNKNSRLLLFSKTNGNALRGWLSALTNFPMYARSLLHCFLHGLPLTTIKKSKINHRKLLSYQLKVKTASWYQLKLWDLSFFLFALGLLSLHNLFPQFAFYFQSLVVQASPSLWSGFIFLFYLL